MSDVGQRIARPFLKPFEIAVIERLTAEVLSPELLQVVIRDGKFIEYDYTGYGYYLTLRHPLLPSQRIVCGGQLALGNAGDVEAGFVVFLESHELLLECYPLRGDPPIPPDFREQVVTLK